MFDLFARAYDISSDAVGRGGLWQGFKLRGSLWLPPCCVALPHTPLSHCSRACVPPEDTIHFKRAIAAMRIRLEKPLIASATHRCCPPADEADVRCILTS